MKTTEEVHNIVNKLAKWRAVFAGWQLGTRPKGDPECDAVRDHREVTILLRAEVSALVNVLIEKKIMTAEEWGNQLATEAEFLDKQYELKFPGFTTFDGGVHMDVKQCSATMEGWRP
jgi:hypothetical protein